MKTNKILAIAITDYDDTRLNKIENCYSDINDIIQLLKEKYKFDDVEFIHKKEETKRKTLFARVNDYLKNCNKGDNVLILFAGHGEYDPSIGVAYWQTSDAEIDDPTSWINVNTVMKLLNVCVAKHISIISDSCFSGAIFEETTRGGGVKALDEKKSREALTSGGIEKVSDGEKGKRSPFAETLLKILTENIQSELLFSQLANNVIINFDPQRKQTPEYGSLSGTGHEGGTFVLELKPEQIQANLIKDKNEYLKSKLRNLFIPINTYGLEIIDKLTNISEEKNAIVRAQKYEEAARLRDIEKEIESNLQAHITEYINELAASVEFTESELKTISILDKQIEEVQTHNKNIMIEYEKENTKLKLKNKGRPRKIKLESNGPSFTLSVNPFSSKFNSLKYKYFLQLKHDPSIAYLFKHKNNFVISFESDIIALFKYFKSIECNTSSEYIKVRADKLNKILSEIILHEAKLLIGKFYDPLDERMGILEIEKKVLTWIKNSDEAE
ncbi:MAG: caspase family protein [Bacteroidia bacterium]|nr:caspase family protein [Bacteroidia bacterium]